MSARVAVLSDVHGNAGRARGRPEGAQEGEAGRRHRRRRPRDERAGARPPRSTPSARWSATARRSSRATRTSPSPTSTTAAAFPWFTDGVPDAHRAAAEWAHDELGDERLGWLRRLPAERRLMLDDTMVLACHASPGSQTQGFDTQLDPSVVLERISRTDARRDLLRPHPPAGGPRPRLEGDRQRRLGRLRLRRRPDRLVGARRDRRRRASTAEIRRTEFDTMAVSNAISARGLPGDVYRAATVRTGKLVR